jgi:hypothetical protein
MPIFDPLSASDAVGRRNRKAEYLLAAIVAELDGQEWTSDTLTTIAEYLRQAGYEIRDPDDVGRDVE